MIDFFLIPFLVLAGIGLGLAVLYLAICAAALLAGKPFDDEEEESE